MELEPAVALVMGSCWDLAIDDVTEAWGIVYHLQVERAGSGVNALLLHHQDFLLKQAGYRASSLKIQTALCWERAPLRPNWGLIFCCYYYIWKLDASSLAWPARADTRSVLYVLLTTKTLRSGGLAVTALTVYHSSAVMSLQLSEQRSTKLGCRQSQNVLFKELGWFMMINGSL